MSPEGESILIVDDEQPVRHMLSRFLKGQGCTVIQAESGAEALGKDRGKGVDVRRPPGEPAHLASRVFGEIAGVMGRTDIEMIRVRGMPPGLLQLQDMVPKSVQGLSHAVHQSPESALCSGHRASSQDR